MRRYLESEPEATAVGVEDGGADDTTIQFPDDSGGTDE